VTSCGFLDNTKDLLIVSFLGKRGNTYFQLARKRCSLPNLSLDFVCIM